MQKPKTLSFDNTEQCKPELPSGSAEDVKQWEEVRCPICMEHPHNAVLLRCSSFDKGCRPFICNTSYRHSNCLDQFCKSSVSSPSTITIQEIPSGRANSCLSAQTDVNGSESQHKLACPLCRGEIYGWFVVDPARKFMNSKTRSCSYENCDFAGNYLELRKHARSDHPTVRPLEVHPERQHNWARLERGVHLSDLRGLITLMNGGGGEEGDVDVELEGPFSADAHELLIFESIIHLLQFGMMGAELINAIGQDDDGDFSNLEMMPRNRNNYRRNNTSIIFNSRQNNFSGNPGERMRRNQNNYGQNSASNNLNSRQNNRFRTNLMERMYMNRNNSGQSNTSSHNLNSRQNNGFRATLVERMTRNQNRYGGNNFSNSNNPNSRQNNSYGGNLSERMRQRRINNIRQRNNLSRRRRLVSRRDGHER
ncbi:uncharacterized protein LOC8258348 [Ricinus communis]|uniref:Uncharacterized protein n=1 Tax=Ricinus communis TaxID=3988 RepID=B9SZV8_RICCO|nr:uncharacterized protein LOC8258348 [Ricinus communis]EEF30846.1 conserved hypothetical protein [Ricinus communis]